MWDNSFGDFEANIKAIVIRGWNPINKACLVMPDIAKTRPKDPPIAAPSMVGPIRLPGVTDGDGWCRITKVN